MENSPISISVKDKKMYDLRNLRIMDQNQETAFRTYNETSPKKGFNVINSTNVNNFITDMANIKTSKDSMGSSSTPTSKSRIKTVTSSSSNIKFGKLTLQRGSGRDNSESKVTLPGTNGKSLMSRNIPPQQLLQGSRTKSSMATKSSHTQNKSVYNKFMTPKIKNPDVIFRTTGNV